MIEGLFDPQPWYVPARDGSLEEYLKLHTGKLSFPVFKGYDCYKELWDKGYFAPGISCLRLMWNIGRRDELFLVSGEYQLKGMTALADGGRQGVHDPRKILGGKNCPPWEPHALHRFPNQET